MNNIGSIQNNGNIILRIEGVVHLGVEGALALIASFGNQISSSPIQSFWTYRFVQEGLRGMEAAGAGRGVHPSPGLHETALYFAFLAAAQGCCKHLCVEGQPLWTLLSTPSGMRQIVQSSAFQQCIRAMFPSGLHLAQKFGAAVLMEYLNGPATFPALTPPEGISAPLEAMQPVVDVLGQEMQYRREILANIVGEMREMRECCSRNLAWDDAAAALVHRASRVEASLSEMTDCSLVSFACNVYQGVPTAGSVIAAPLFHQRVLTAWWAGGGAAPSAAPLLFMSATPDCAEIVVRVGGVGIAALTQQAFIANLTTECLLKLVPPGIRDSRANQAMFAGTKRWRGFVMQHINAFVRGLETDLAESGYSKSQIDWWKKAMLQPLSAASYLIFVDPSSAWTAALCSEFFYYYLSAIAANHGLARQELFVSQSSWIGLPYKLAVACFTSLLEVIGPSPTVPALLATAATMPLISDAVVLHPKYSQAVRKRFYSVFPDMRILNQVKNSAIIGHRAVQWGSKFLDASARPVLQCAEIAAGLGIVVAAADKVRKAVRNPAVQRTCRQLTELGQWALQTAVKYQSVSLCSQFVGNTFGSFAALVGKPFFHPKTVVLGVVGAATGYGTASPLLIAAAVEIADVCLTRIENHED